MTGVPALEFDRFFGETASATRVWVSVGAACAVVSIAFWLIHETIHRWKLARIVRAGLDKSDVYGREYIDELLHSLGREREEDGRALFVLRLSLWILVWLVTTAIGFFIIGETRATPQEIEDGSFIFRNNEGFTAALALIVALASSAIAPIYVELLNRRRARELEIRAAEDQLRQHLQQINQRMDAIWSHFEEVVFPFVRNWLAFLAREPGNSIETADADLARESRLQLTKEDIEFVATRFSEMLHGDPLFLSYCETNLISTEDRAAFMYLLQRWRRENRRVPWGDEQPNGERSAFYANTVLTPIGQQDAESALLNPAKNESPLMQVLRWAQTSQPDFSQVEKTFNYKRLRILRESWVTAHALTDFPKRDIRGVNAKEKEMFEEQKIKNGDWYAWIARGYSLCEPQEGDSHARRRDIGVFFPQFSLAIENFFPSSEVTLIPLIAATDRASSRMKDPVLWSIRGLAELQTDLEYRTRYHFNILEESIALARNAAKSLGINIDVLLEDADLFRELCKGPDRNDPSKSESSSSDPKQHDSTDWGSALLARRLYYGIVLLRLKRTQERRTEGALHLTHQMIRAAFEETLTFAKTLLEERSINPKISIGAERWFDVRRVLEASRARSAVHILSRAALSAARREKLIEVTSSASVPHKNRDTSSIDPRLRNEVRLALFKRKVGMPLAAITRLRLLPLAEIVTSRPPVFIEERLDSVVRAVSQRIAESPVGQEKFASN